jgi:hypothetical protein
MTPTNETSFPPRRYTLKPSLQFHTGRLDDGRQVLLGLLCPEVVTYFFSAAGDLTGVERRAWRTPAPRLGDVGPYQISEPAFAAEIERQIEDWKRELAAADGPIHIHAFFDDAHFVGIEPIPGHLEEPDDDAEAPQEREERLVERKEWIQSGRFVFWWAEDYWMTPQGDVVSN